MATLSSPTQALLAETKRVVDARLSALFEREFAGLGDCDGVLISVLKALGDLSLRGGKRLRAWLAVVGEQTSGGGQREAAWSAGVALELLQSYFLIHDDWMDQDRLRRGGPTVHVALESEFGSVSKGASGAILAGDYAVALATEVLAEIDIPSARLPRVMACFGRMQRDAVLGQELDVLADRPDPETVCRLKTSSYTVLGPLKLGALIGGASADVLDVLEQFAAFAGLGFQWRDDLLSAFGDPARTGKPRGNDLVAGKPTLLSQRAFELATDGDATRLRRVFGNARATADEISEALNALERSGARAAVEERVAELAGEARAIAKNPALDSLARDLLLDSVELLIGRSA